VQEKLDTSSIYEGYLSIQLWNSYVFPTIIQVFVKNWLPPSI